MTAVSFRLGLALACVGLGLGAGGCTPLRGHSGYLIEGDGESLLLWGDALHLSDLQASDPDIGFVYDLDAGTALASRRGILGRAAHENWLVSGGHVEGFRRVIKKGAGYELVAA